MLGTDQAATRQFGAGTASLSVVCLAVCDAPALPVASLLRGEERPVGPPASRLSEHLGMQHLTQAAHTHARLPTYLNFFLVFP